MQRLLANLLIAAMLVIAGGARAQDALSGWNPRSGDPWVDAQLADINRYGLRYRDPFVDEMTRYYGAPRELVGELLLRRHWAPGDIYFACALAQVAGRPCRYVVDEWQRDHARGWGALAQRLGIRPGSPEFHRLKRGVVPSFDRWGRPIELDASLARDFPGRGAPHARGRDGVGEGATGQPGRSGEARGDEEGAPSGPPGPAGDDAPSHGRGQGGGHGHGHG